MANESPPKPEPDLMDMFLANLNANAKQNPEEDQNIRHDEESKENEEQKGE